MRVDAASARTWLLAAIAGWAGAAWLLAVLGMGGRIVPLADDPGLIQPIPALPAGSASRLGPIGQYAEFGARPLFAEDRRPKPFSLQGGAEGADTAQAFDFVLTGVLITPRVQLATLQSADGSKSERVKLGEAPESLPAWRLSALNARSAVFDGPGEQRTIELRVFDGIGGQPPTPASRAGQPTGTMGVPLTPPANGNGTGNGTATGAAPRPTSTPAAPTSSPAPGAAKPQPAAPAASTPQMTEQAQMEAIRQRIQARRAQLRQQQAQPTQPPAQDK